MIRGVEGEGRDADLTLERNDARAGRGKARRAAARAISTRRKLMLTEALIRESLRAGKLAADAAEEDAGRRRPKSAPRRGPGPFSRPRPSRKPKPLVPAGVQAQFKKGARAASSPAAARSEEENEPWPSAPTDLRLLQIADAVAREKSIDRSDRASPRWRTRCKRRRARATGRRPRSAPRSIRAPAKCAFRACCSSSTRSRTTRPQISLADARKRNPAAQVGDWIAETLPPFDFGRIAAQSAKQVIVQKVREAERDRQYEEYKDRIGEIVNGVVKRVEYGNVIVDLGRGEGDHPPRRDDPARNVPPRRPRARLCL